MSGEHLSIATGGSSASGAGGAAWLGRRGGDRLGWHRRLARWLPARPERTGVRFAPRSRHFGSARPATLEARLRAVRPHCRHGPVRAAPRPWAPDTSLRAPKPATHASSLRLPLSGRTRRTQSGCCGLFGRRGRACACSPRSWKVPRVSTSPTATMQQVPKRAGRCQLVYPGMAAHCPPGRLGANRGPVAVAPVPIRSTAQTLKRPLRRFTPCSKPAARESWTTSRRRSAASGQGDYRPRDIGSVLHVVGRIYGHL